MMPYAIIPQSGPRTARILATPGIAGALCIAAWDDCAADGFSGLLASIAQVSPAIPLMLGVGAGGSAPTIPGVPTVTLSDGAVYQIPWHPDYLAAYVAMMTDLREALEPADLLGVWGVKAAIFNPASKNGAQTLGLSLPGSGDTDASIWAAAGYDPTTTLAAWVGALQQLGEIWPGMLSIPLDQPGAGGSNVLDPLAYLAAACNALPGRIETVDVSFTAGRERPIFAAARAVGCSLAVQFEAQATQADLVAAIAAVGSRRAELHPSNFQFDVSLA